MPKTNIPELFTNITFTAATLLVKGLPPKIFRPVRFQLRTMPGSEAHDGA